MTPAELEDLGAIAYQAFCDSAKSFLPTAYNRPDWNALSPVVRDAWKAAAAAAVRGAAK